MIPLPTASGIDRALRCPASVVLPQTNERSSGPAERGITIHRYLERVSILCEQIGIFDARNVALGEVPEEYKDACGSIPLDRLGIEQGHGQIAEAAFAWDYVTGEGRFLGSGKGRDYSAKTETEFAGTADRVLKLEDRVVVKDTKTGHGFIAQAGWNRQLRSLALFACRAWGKDAATVEIERIGENGSVEIDRAELDMVDLDATAAELRALVANLSDAQAKVAAGQRPDLSEGRHCTYCPAWEACPAKINLIKEFLADGAMILNGLDLPTAYQKIRTMEAAAKRGLEAIKGTIERSGQPLDIGNGMVYGPTARGFREHAR